MIYHFKIRKSGNKYWAEGIELKGCRTQASNKSRLTKAMSEALNLFLSEPDDSQVIFAMPDMRLKGPNIVGVSVKPRVAFAASLRRTRIEAGLTQKQACERMKLGGLFSYQRLESPRWANPQLDTLIRIKTVFPKFQLDRIL